MSAKINKIILFLFHFKEKNVGGPIKQVKKSVALPKCKTEISLNLCTKLACYNQTLHFFKNEFTFTFKGRFQSEASYSYKLQPPQKNHFSVDRPFLIHV